MQGRHIAAKFWRPLDHRGGDISHQIALPHAYSRTIPCRLHRDFGNLTRLPHRGNFGITLDETHPVHQQISPPPAGIRQASLQGSNSTWCEVIDIVLEADPRRGKTIASHPICQKLHRMGVETLHQRLWIGNNLRVCQIGGEFC